MYSLARLGLSRLCLCLLISLLSTGVNAEEVAWLPMKQLLNEGKPIEAYQLGDELKDEWEGVPDFDYYYGMAAIDAGHVSLGVFALERVLYVKPGFIAAQLELARGYYLLQQYDLAEQGFLRVLNTKPPRNVRERINMFLAAIEKRDEADQPRLLAYIEAIAGYDSNTNFAPDDAEFFSPILGDGVLDESGVSKADGYNDFLGGLAYYKPYSDTTTHYVRLDMAHHNVWWTSSLDTLAYTVQVGLFHELSVDNTLTAQAFYQDYELDSEGYRSMTGMAISDHHNLSAKSSLQFGLSYLDFDYDELDNRDAKEYNLSLGYKQQTHWLYPALWQIAANWGHDDPDEDSVSAKAQTDRDFWRLAIYHRVPISNNIGLTASASYQDSDYAGRDVLFQTTREDELQELAVRVDWRMDLNWQLKFELGYKEQSSNIEIYEFDRTHAQIGVRYEYY